MPLMLCYNINGDNGSKLRFAAMRCGIRIREVKREEFSLPLSALCAPAAETPEPYSGEGFDSEMLVFCAFPQGLVSRFLNEARTLRAKPVALKAILTETNAEWDSVTLMKELQKEHEAMTGGAKPVHGNA
ncbi:MAG: DUF3783 domain-containing protein [Eubacteriales bacterium]|nr:DUF3783 domain-containing protein [Eubacteriales bacterium]